MNSPVAEARVLARLLRGMPRQGSQAERLQGFYGPQARHYDAFRERLLRGRRALIRTLDVPDGAAVVELGAGTGRNLAFFGERLGRLGRVDLVDLCPALAEEARRRVAGLAARGIGNVRVHLADATAWRPAAPVDCVYLSYALTMIPDWWRAIDNALSMLKPGGALGIVDFYVGPPNPRPGTAAHGLFTRMFWPRWFAHDGVHPTPAHLARLRLLLPQHVCHEGRAPVPYLPGLRAPYYIFVGRRGD
jgi:S-adenosylmethionine-diacylgycerolhomoserine-N-methlytransferase